MKKHKRFEIKVPQNFPKQDTSPKYVSLERGILENTEENKGGIHWRNNFLSNFIQNLWESPKLCIKFIMYDNMMVPWEINSCDEFGMAMHPSLFLSLLVQKSVK